MVEANWRELVTDPREISVFEALQDPEWDWRTLGALSSTSGLSREEVRSVLNEYPLFVRKSAVRSTGGEELYTLQIRYFERKSPLEKGWGFLSSSSSTST